MKKHLYILGCLLITFSFSFSQSHNSWIDPSYQQKYLKIKVAQNGIYRIDRNSLSNAVSAVGENLTSIHPKQFQVYSRGEEQFIHVNGEGDGSFDASDYIEFYAESNDGWLDALIYMDGNGNIDPSAQANPHYSLFNDTATYFLTWKTGSADTNNRRLTELTSSTFPGTPLPYIWTEVIENKKDEYLFGKLNSNDKADPEITAGEGWFSSRFSHHQSSNYRDFSISTPNVYTASGAPDAILRSAVAGASNASQTPDHRVNILIGENTSNLQLVKDTSFEGYALTKYKIPVPSSQVQNTTVVRFRAQGPTTFPPTSYMGVSHVYFKYPHTPDLGNSSEFPMYVPDGTGSQSYLNLSGFSASSAILYDLTGNYRITPSVSSGTVKAMVPNAGTDKKCFLVSESSINQVTQLIPAGNNGKFTDYTQSGKDSAFIIIAHKKLWNEAVSYRNYRNSKGYNVLLADIEELYDQFAYGVAKHPLAIRHFSEYLLSEWSSAPPQNLFLIGKAIYNHQSRNNPSRYARNLIPTVGFPGSDAIYTAYMNGSQYDMAIPVGRLGATKTVEVADYENKVREFEQNTTRPYFDLESSWMKRVLHFSGGASDFEQRTFKKYLKAYEKVIEDAHFSGDVYSFYKTTTDPIVTNISDSVAHFINSGTSLITFFGHAAGSSFEISIGKPDEYSNSNGKYPLIIANSCNAGDVHQSSSISTSEEFVLSDRGAVAFLASTSLGYQLNLHAYTNEVYEQMSKKNYGRSVGFYMQQAAKTVQNKYPSFPGKSTCLEMSLHGDPSLKINPFPKPDFAISSANVFTTPDYITTELDSFTLNILPVNLGKGIDSTISCNITHISPGGIKSNYFTSFDGASFRDSITQAFPVNKEFIGLNTFEIMLDPTYKYEELKENNNYLSYQVLVSSADLVPVHPHEFAIVPGKDITLKASTSDPLAPERKYIIQIDRDDEFNNPVEQKFTSKGGVVEWDVAASVFSEPLSDSTVYYWRCSPDPASPDVNEYSWRESSFQIIQDKRGWAQADFFQFKNNEYSTVKFERGPQEFNFRSQTKTLTCRNIGNPTTEDEMFNIEFKLDGVLGDYGVCQGKAAINIAIIDSSKLQFWETYHSTANPDLSHSFGNANDGSGCVGTPDQNFIFYLSNPTQMDNMADMLAQIDDGHYILAYSTMRGLFQDTTIWKDHHFEAFENLGATDIRNVPNQHPYIFFAQKGRTSSAVEMQGDHNRDTILLKLDVSTLLDYGYITSPVIGPAKEWKSLHWRQFAKEVGAKDSVLLTVFGLNNGSRDTITQLWYSDKDLPDLYNYVNASQYPFLQLEVYIEDTLLQTSAQMDRWQVIYEGVPEAALNYGLHFNFHADTLQQGEDLQFSIAIRNISDYPMDSLNVSYWVETSDRKLVEIDYPTQPPLLAGNVIQDKISYNTGNLLDHNSFWIEVNPKNSDWQLEQYHFNNIARLPFYVQSDKSNPLLDVTFDGIHILDGDIVSPSPEINISLKDENLFLALDDTSDFSLYLTDPEGYQERLYFINSSGEEVLKFTPAALPDNHAKIMYNPEFQKDGKYELMVRAQDKSSNKAGDYDYSISFEVINRSTITEILNYPNPFSTSTRFVFTLTGSEVPEIFTIQILTVTGKVIREITRDELGPVNIGRNISQYAWDGRDEFGDPLANGVYLYRVITKINGETIEHRETKADEFFHKGFGKMYLMR